MKTPRQSALEAPILRCDIATRESSEFETLAAVATQCAQELGFELVPTQTGDSGADEPPRILLRVPSAAIAPGGQVWCLACRLATYCRRARVSVEVSARDAFSREGRQFRGLRKRGLRAAV